MLDLAWKFIGNSNSAICPVEDKVGALLVTSLTMNIEVVNCKKIRSNEDTKTQASPSRSAFDVAFQDASEVSFQRVR